MGIIKNFSEYLNESYGTGYTFKIGIDAIAILVGGESYYDLPSSKQRKAMTYMNEVIGKVKVDIPDLESKGMTVNVSPELIEIENISVENLLYVTQKLIENWVTDINVLYDNDIFSMIPWDDICDDLEGTPEFDELEEYIYHMVES